MWFSFDGETFELHATEQGAQAEASRAMEYWRDCASEGWDELSTQVCYGVVTHAVRVETIDVTEENKYLIPPGCDGCEDHHLERVVPEVYRCNICGGLVSFD